MSLKLHAKYAWYQEGAGCVAVAIKTPVDAASSAGKLANPDKVVFLP